MSGLRKPLPGNKLILWDIQNDSIDVITFNIKEGVFINACRDLQGSANTVTVQKKGDSKITVCHDKNTNESRAQGGKSFL